MKQNICLKLGAKKNLKTLKKITKIYSSPLGRAKETSEIINTYLDVEIDYDDR